MKSPNKFGKKRSPDLVRHYGSNFGFKPDGVAELNEDRIGTCQY